MVLVSSGAIGVGLKRMDMASRPKSVSGKQVRMVPLLDINISSFYLDPIRPLPPSAKAVSLRYGIIYLVSWANQSPKFCSPEAIYPM